MTNSQCSTDTKLSRRSVLRAGVLGSGACLLGQANVAAGADPETDGYIDAHVHVWTPDTKSYPLTAGFDKTQMKPPSFTPEQLFAHARPSGVRRIVLIQMSFYGFDNTYMLERIRKHAGVFAGVAVIDENVRPCETMKTLAAQGVRGFRIGPGRQTPDQWLTDGGMTAMWRCGAERNLAMCPLINPKYLPSIDRMCDEFPRTPVVVDHFARIGIDGKFHENDLDNLCRLARHENVRVKVSAFYALGAKKAPYLDLGPMIRRVLNAFGPQRLMWASDCPYQVVNGHTYANSIDLIRTRLDFLTPTDRDWLLRKTAERTFFA